MLKILVLGGTGYLGSSLVPKLKDDNFEVLVQGRFEGCDVRFDPSDFFSTLNTLAECKPDVIINLVAATNVDECEKNPNIAWNANVKVSASLVNAIEHLSPAYNPFIVYISTDQVYSKKDAHSEKFVDPVNIYGVTKYAADLIFRQMSGAIIRTNFFGKSKRADRMSFSDWLVNSLRSKIPITLFDDIVFSPLHVDSLCDYIIQIINNRIQGVFNVGSRDSISKADFGFELARMLGLSTDNVRIGSMKDSKLFAHRPSNMAMSTKKIESALNLCCLPVIHEIRKAALEYRND